MNENRVLDASLIKDLSNHIYEKRKATAFQIEGLTKSAFQRNDSETISKIIAELTELTNGGSNSAKMGAITALGSVSVALGSFAIAFFLKDIIRPIFATFKDIDARVRYYACESLYNIAKIARGEILFYFNEVFDILCILVTDSESSVKNAADILDRLIKDIVSAKSTNYVSILQQQENANSEVNSHIVNAEGVAIQVNQIQEAQKAFSLPRFIPTLLERMYTIDPFAKKFLISWLELFDDIPSLELITFLPNFLEPLFKFLMNNCPSDVRIETQNLLNIFLKEIKSIYKVKFEIKRQQILQDKSRERAMAKREQHEKERSLQQEQQQPQAPPLASSELQPDSQLQSPLSQQEQSHGNGLNSSGSTTSVSQQPNDVNDVSNGVQDLHVNSNANGETSSIKSTDTTLIRKTSNANDHAIIDSSYENYSDDGSLFMSGQDIFIDYLKIIDILLSFLRLASDARSDTKVNDLSSETHDIYLEIQLTALKWLQEILLISPTSFVKFLPDCVSITMKNISVTDSNKDYDLRNQFLKFNLSLQDFIVNLIESGERDGEGTNLNSKLDGIRNDSIADKEIDNIDDVDGDDAIVVDIHEVQGLTKEVYEEFLEFYLNKTLKGIMTECLTCANEFARLTSLDWLIFLYSKIPSSFFENLSDKSLENGISDVDAGAVDSDTFDLTTLLRSSADASNEVISKVLHLLSRISETNQDFFRSFMIKLIKFFETDGSDAGSDKVFNGTTRHGIPSQSGPLSRSKIEFIIRKLCVTLNSEKIYKILSEVLASYDEDKLDFLNMMVVTLNNILLTTQELAGFRKKLKNLDMYKLEDWSLFATLFQSWCHNPPSALSLCLLTSNYELAYLIIKCLAESEVTFQLLTQLDILVQLLETPIFLKLRLQLLEPEKNPHLYKTLYGILMILPQSSTYTTLKNRLSSLSNFTNNINAPFGAGGTMGPLGTPVSTPGNTTSTPSNSLSIKKKRIYEMLDKFTRTQEKHETAHSKFKDTFYSDNDAQKRILQPYARSSSDAPMQSSQSQIGRNDRLMSYNVGPADDRQVGSKRITKHSLT